MEYITEMILGSEYNIEVEVNEDGIIPDNHFTNFHQTLLRISQIALYFTKYNSKQSYNISILLCDNEYITNLNGRYRHKNYATNVLSFEDGEVINGIKFLGDIALSIPKIKKEALDQGKLFRTHFLHMFTHGVLHILGFDHQNTQDRQAMENLEDRVLAQIL